MTPVMILMLGSLASACGLLLFTTLMIRYRKEDIAFFFFIAAIFSSIAMVSTFREALTKAEHAQHIPMDVQP